MFRKFLVMCPFLALAAGHVCFAAGDDNAVVLPASCSLSVQATDDVLLPGESCQISVFASLPAADAYAFADVNFDVAADLPSWTFVSDGVVAGANVLGAEAWQDHNPFEGDPADPANPLRIWTSKYTPDSYEPQLVKIEATPNDFWYYPSELTGSSASCDGVAGSDWIMVNPLSVGEASIAPAAGTTMRMVSSSRIGDERYTYVFMGTPPGGADEVMFGMRMPQGHHARLEPKLPPSSLEIENEVQEAQRSMVTSLRVTFSEAINPATYDVSAHWPPADEYELVIHTTTATQKRGKIDLSSFAGQTVRIRFQAADASNASLNFSAFPTSFSGGVYVATSDLESGAFSRFAFDKAIKVVVPDGRAFMANAIEVRAIQNNLKQITLGVHTVRSHHSGGMLVGMGDGSVRNISSSVNP